MCFIFEPNAHIASHHFALKEQEGVAVLVEEERRPAICHGTVHPKSEMCHNEVDIGGNKRGRFTKLPSLTWHSSTGHERSAPFSPAPTDII